MGSSPWSLVARWINVVLVKLCFGEGTLSPRLERLSAFDWVDWVIVGLLVNPFQKFLQEIKVFVPSEGDFIGCMRFEELFDNELAVFWWSVDRASLVWSWESEDSFGCDGCWGESF